MTGTGAVAQQLEGGVLTLRLERPAKRNALSQAMVEGLHAGLDRAALEADVRVVCLRGAGRDFCAGADLAELLASREASPAENEASAFRLGEVFIRIRALEKPVVSVVHGRALAGGAGLATACDLVIAADTAQVGFPEMQRGFVPAMVMTLLRRLVGERAAFDLAATGRVVAADEARRLGLVTRVVPEGELELAAGDMLAALAGSSATAMALTKRLLHELDGKGFEEGIRLGARVNALARATPDFERSIAAFLG